MFAEVFELEELPMSELSAGHVVNTILTKQEVRLLIKGGVIEKYD